MYYYQNCLDAQICSLSWVSFGLEPASDGSRRLHLPSTATLSRLGSSSTTTPSTSTVTSGTVCRPQPRPARCRPAAHGPGGRVRVGPGRRALACVGCALSRRWRLPAVLLHAAERLRGSDPGRSGRVGPLRLLTGLGHAAPCPPGSLMELSSGRGHAAPRSPEESRRRQLAAGPRGPLRLSSGRGPTHPVRRSGHLTVGRPPGHAVHATASRAGGPAHPDRRWRLLTVCRPAGRAVRATASRAGGPAHPDRRRRLRTVRRPAGRSGFRVGCTAASGPQGSPSRPPGRAPPPRPAGSQQPRLAAVRHVSARARGPGHEFYPPRARGRSLPSGADGRQPSVPQVQSVWTSGPGSPAGVGY